MNNICAYGAADWTVYIVYVCDTRQNGTIGWRGDELLNKVVIFVFSAQKVFS